MPDEDNADEEMPDDKYKYVNVLLHNSSEITKLHEMVRVKIFLIRGTLNLLKGVSRPTKNVLQLIVKSLNVAPREFRFLASYVDLQKNIS